jgi:uncharacterized protein (TIGR02271 family)
VPITNPETLKGQTVTGSDGGKLGKVDDVYLDTQTGRPEWAAVKTGLFGGNVSLVPLATAQVTDSGLQVPYDKDQITKAPYHDPGQELSPSDEAELFEHYGVAYGGDTVTAQTGDQHDHGDQSSKGARDPHGSGEAAEGRDVSGPTTDDAMTRSEERLQVGTQTSESGRARLRKYVVTETVTQTVPVSHEEIRVEREPITDANRDAAMAGGDITEEEHEITLHEERPVVAKETVPVERVRMSTETVRDEEQVSEQVRKEQIDTTGVANTSDTAGRAGRADHSDPTP